MGGATASQPVKTGQELMLTTCQTGPFLTALRTWPGPSQERIGVTPLGSARSVRLSEMREGCQGLTTLEKKREEEQPFTKDDLLFLYETNAPIEGFVVAKCVVLQAG